MRSPKQPISRPRLDSRPRSQPTTGKLRYFRPLPYHIALSQAARLEAWTQDVEALSGPAEASDSTDFDPKLMERPY
ncbi:MAG: hypothetical protein F6K11_01530 [Leptolyngbya sp. SIO3F4]|nr:hypothetical protein [Leptolyngbya sp. SIO3F4]